jgi:hypothetical protein
MVKAAEDAGSVQNTWIFESESRKYLDGYTTLLFDGWKLPEQVRGARQVSVKKGCCLRLRKSRNTSGLFLAESLFIL